MDADVQPPFPYGREVATSAVARSRAERMGDAATARIARLGLLGALGLMATAVMIPWLTGWDVYVHSVPPLRGGWDPRLGPGTVPAIVLAAMAVLGAGPVSRVCRWRHLLVGSWVFSAAWMVSLATVDGWNGIGQVLGRDDEYLGTARSVTDVWATLHEYVARIPFSASDEWPVHVAGHPPGALLFFVALTHLGLGSGLAAGWVVILVAATTPAAVLTTVRTLGAEDLARRAAPFLVFGPAAIWLAVSADAVFGAVAAWGTCCLAYAARSASRSRLAAWAVASGLLFGYLVMMSYGLPLFALVALAVPFVSRAWRPLPWVAGAALAVVLGFSVGGFSWWEGYPVLTVRYWQGIAQHRPGLYWTWGDLAALCFSAGPAIGSAVASVVAQGRDLVGFRGGLRIHGHGSERVVVALTGAAAVAVLVADLSQMSRAEVERIWLPFVPWLLLGTALVPAPWRRRLLVVQLAVALVVQHLYYPSW